MLAASVNRGKQAENSVDNHNNLGSTKTCGGNFRVETSYGNYSLNVYIENNQHMPLFVTV